MKREGMKVRLIATDLDGTLLDDKKQVSARNREALRRASAKGILYVPATGRIFDAIPEPIRDFPFLRYAITVNGSGVYDRRQRKMLFRAEIPREQAADMCRFMRQYETLYDCYIDGRGYMEQRYYEQIDLYFSEVVRPLVRETRTQVQDLAECIRERGDVQKMQMLFRDMDLRARVLRELPEAFPNTLSTSSVSNNIEINIREANKGDALTRLCGYLGIDMSETLVFGDGGNDVTMLRAAGTGVAMGNACEEARAAADRFTLTNEEDGVADFLEKYVL